MTRSEVHTDDRTGFFVAQAWPLVCATVLILEATLTPDRLRAHEASIPRRGSVEPAVAGIDPV